MKISIAATNPCHLFSLARELAGLELLGCYYSGYPRWKLRGTEEMVVRTHSWRVVVSYACFRYWPEKLRPSADSFFRWHDSDFDAWVGRHLDETDFIHAMPGQCLNTFRRARQMGVRTVLNHATGPGALVRRVLDEQYALLGIRKPVPDSKALEQLAREQDEYALADFHCCASQIVRDQLIEQEVPAERIWLVPYGADADIFYPRDVVRGDGAFRILFGGQLVVRKGIHFLLQALESVDDKDWELHMYGSMHQEGRPFISAYKGCSSLMLHGAVSQHQLAEAFAHGDVLVLPSVEDGFGLVVVQALNCGLPCIVSDRVGAKDLIRHRENGSIVPVGDIQALANELRWWQDHRKRVPERHGWHEAAKRLANYSATALNAQQTIV